MRALQEVSPEVLAPLMESHRRFQGAYPVPGTQVFLSLMEGKAEGANRVCHVQSLGGESSLGSTDGPVLQVYGAVAAIHYGGRLAEAAGEISIDQE